MSKSTIQSSKSLNNGVAVEEEHDRTPVSFLEPNTVRWMNKRRTKGARAADGKLIPSAAKPLVTPSQALYLRSIFKGLDYDNNGEMYDLSIHHIRIVTYLFLDRCQSLVLP